MAKWRPVDVRVWSDRKFLSLSDRGKTLWLYLLTSPFMLPIPGVIVAGELASAEQLGWTAEGFREGFQELLDKGLGVTRSGRLIWLRKALEYQPIQGPNHIAAIAKSWDDVPVCELKVEIWQVLKIACKGWSGLFAKGVPEPVVNPLDEPVANPFRTVSGTVTGSGSEKDLPLPRKRSSGPRDPKPPVPGHQETIACFTERFESAYGTKPTWDGRRAKQVQNLLRAHGEVEVKRRIGILFSGGLAWPQGPYDFDMLVKHFDKLAQPARAGPQNGRGGPTVLQTLLSDIEILEREELEKTRQHE